MSSPTETTLEALRKFAEVVSQKHAAIAAGAPEDQMAAPLETLLRTVGEALNTQVVPKNQSRLPDRTGIPDYAVVVDQLLAGYIELKAPGKGAYPGTYSGHDADQWERFQTLPNILYTDGEQWGLYRTGERPSPVVKLSGDLVSDGKKAVEKEDAQKLLSLLTDFLEWEPSVPSNADQLAENLAPLCRNLREEVREALTDSSSPLTTVADEWRELLFPEADDDTFADAYAQTVTYALLLARTEDAEVLRGPGHAANVLQARNALLARALRVLTDTKVREEIQTSLNVLQRVIDRVDPDALEDGEEEPWLYFYEDFLAKYDPQLRKDAGAYFTNVEVVRAQVALIDELLKNDLGKRLGFADEEVVTLDPGVGTGTYLLGVIEHTLEWVRQNEGEGNIPARASALADNLHGFENMVGPYAVAELRLTQALSQHGGQLPDGPKIFLTDTLESPTADPPAPKFGSFYKPLAEEHRRALEIKESTRVLVCVGNPPYDRHAADDSTKGGWVRHGGDGQEPILKDFTDPATKAGHSQHLKNLYNLYVYFWRWALWKVFEHKTATGPGVVSFISASSYLEGDAFVGMRELMRRLCDDIWIIDLGGEGRGPRTTENVFPSVRTPVAIAVASRQGEPDLDTPATVRYTDLRDGTRKEKLKELDAIDTFGDLNWDPCPTEWQAAFLPEGAGDYFSWPRLTSLFPWHHSGVQVKRTWPIGPTQKLLERRWKKLLNSKDREKAFKETRDRKVAKSYLPLRGSRNRLKPIADLTNKTPTPPIERYGYRSFDRQWVIADGRVGDFLRPVYWNLHSDQQVYLTSLFNTTVGKGPAVTACAHVPDIHHFRGSYGGRDVMPLWRDQQATEPNLLPGLLDVLEQSYGSRPSPEDVLAYVYGLLAQPGYVEQFYEELDAPDPDSGIVPPRVPLTEDGDLFERIRDVGSNLLFLHTYGERFVPEGYTVGDIPQGSVRCTKGVPQKESKYPNEYRYEAAEERLYVGEGVFEPVKPEIWNYEVSGLEVVDSWLSYRMAEPAGRKGSPLNDITPNVWTANLTRELLELLWVLEHTLDAHPEQSKLLRQVQQGELIDKDDLPDVPEEAREKPDFSRSESSQLELGPFVD